LAFGGSGHADTTNSLIEAKDANHSVGDGMQQGLAITREGGEVLNSSAMESSRSLASANQTKHVQSRCAPGTKPKPPLLSSPAPARRQEICLNTASRTFGLARNASDTRTSAMRWRLC
jgi:hypothetical protein